MAIAVVLAADQMKIEIKFEIEVGIRKINQENKSKVGKSWFFKKLEKVTDGITPAPSDVFSYWTKTKLAIALC